MITIKDNDVGVPFESLTVGEVFIYTDQNAAVNLHYKFNASSAVYLVSGEEKECTFVGDPYAVTKSTMVHRVKILNVTIKKFKLP
jgi:hypothetical protein